MKYISGLLLILTLVSCDKNSPENIKNDQETNAKCETRCKAVGREMDTAASYDFVHGCTCKDESKK